MTVTFTQLDGQLAHMNAAVFMAKAAYSCQFVGGLPCPSGKHAITTWTMAGKHVSPTWTMAAKHHVLPPCCAPHAAAGMAHVCCMLYI